MTVIEKIGVGFFPALGVTMIGLLAWSFLTESGQAARENAGTEKTRIGREVAAEKNKLAVVEAMNASAAWAACKEFAELKLGPAKTRTWSETFPMAMPWSRKALRPYDAGVVGEYVLGGENQYRVRGYVDSFVGDAAGTVFRNHIDCTLTEVSLDEWTLDHLGLE